MFVDQFDTFGWAGTCRWRPATCRSSIEALVDGKFVSLRVPYPMASIPKGSTAASTTEPRLEGQGAVVEPMRARALSLEGGKGTTSKVVQFQLRPIAGAVSTQCPRVRRSHNLTVSEALRVPAERSETRDPGPKTREPTVCRPGIPALAPAAPSRPAGHESRYTRLVTDQLQRVSCVALHRIRDVAVQGSLDYWLSQ